MDALDFALDADRRLDRTEDALGALAKLAEATRKRAGLAAVTVSDGTGMLLAGAGAHRLCEELAAWAPLVGRGADNDTVPSCLDAFEGRTRLRRFAIDGFEIVVSFCGPGAESSAELDAVSAGCARILKRR
ncbi:MAG TPA: hypothetical protein VMI54_16185 [Polyangiaceae bacterium]|nr:hypothetical protein [Polyangiaceae bacterium]